MCVCVCVCVLGSLDVHLFFICRWAVAAQQRHGRPEAATGAAPARRDDAAASVADQPPQTTAAHQPHRRRRPQPAPTQRRAAAAPAPLSVPAGAPHPLTHSFSFGFFFRVFSAFSYILTPFRIFGEIVTHSQDFCRSERRNFVFVFTSFFFLNGPRVVEFSTSLKKRCSIRELTEFYRVFTELTNRCFRAARLSFFWGSGQVQSGKRCPPPPLSFSDPADAPEGDPARIESRAVPPEAILLFRSRPFALGRFQLN